MQRSPPVMNRTYLRDVQYRDSTKLAARASLHVKYGRAEVPWFDWIAIKADLPERAAVLDIGCGAGWFWEKAAAHVPETIAITLADISPGMVAEALGRVRGVGRWRSVEGREADLSELPFPDAHFDAVLACHMLYHLPDPSKVVAEIARVLRPGGRAIVTTNGIANLRELHPSIPDCATVNPALSNWTWPAAGAPVAA